MGFWKKLWKKITNGAKSIFKGFAKAARWFSDKLNKLWKFSKILGFVFGPLFAGIIGILIFAGILVSFAFIIVAIALAIAAVVAIVAVAALLIGILIGLGILLLPLGIIILIAILNIGDRRPDIIWGLLVPLLLIFPIIIAIGIHATSIILTGGGLSFPAYGNYCGPLYGNDNRDNRPDPIDDIDRLCQEHDDCYADHQYFSCKCDEKLLEALPEAIANTDDPAAKAAGIAIMEYFALQEAIHLVLFCI